MECALQFLNRLLEFAHFLLQMSVLLHGHLQCRIASFLFGFHSFDHSVHALQLLLHIRYHCVSLGQILRQTLSPAGLVFELILLIRVGSLEGLQLLTELEVVFFLSLELIGQALSLSCNLGYFLLLLIELILEFFVLSFQIQYERFLFASFLLELAHESFGLFFFFFFII